MMEVILGCMAQLIVLLGGLVLLAIVRDIRRRRKSAFGSWDSYLRIIKHAGSAAAAAGALYNLTMHRPDLVERACKLIRRRGLDSDERLRAAMETATLLAAGETSALNIHDGGDQAQQPVSTDEHRGERLS